MTAPTEPRRCKWCPYAMYAKVVVGVEGEEWIVFWCERCDRAS